MQGSWERGRSISFRGVGRQEEESAHGCSKSHKSRNSEESEAPGARVVSSPQLWVVCGFHKKCREGTAVTSWIQKAPAPVSSIAASLGQKTVPGDRDWLQKPLVKLTLG